MRERSDSVIVTGADSGYFDLLEDLLKSLQKTGAIPARPIAILDFGFTDAQREILKRYTDLVIKPDYDLNVPPALRKEAELGRLSRPFLPRYFPGYDYYVWIDADIWVQDASFIDDYVAAARRTKIAIVKESERAYRLQPWLISWSIKNFCSMFGVPRGLYLCACTPINNGLFAMAADAPHWDAWAKYYQEGLDRSGKLYNQFSLAAAIHLDNLPVTYMPGTHNWICDRGFPVWDPNRRMFCAPYRGHAPISVMHLAGPAKSGRYRLRTTDGSSIFTSLRYSAQEMQA